MATTVMTAMTMTRQGGVPRSQTSQSHPQSPRPLLRAIPARARAFALAQSRSASRRSDACDVQSGASESVTSGRNDANASGETAANQAVMAARHPQSPLQPAVQAAVTRVVTALLPPRPTLGVRATASRIGVTSQAVPAEAAATVVAITRPRLANAQPLHRLRQTAWARMAGSRSGCAWTQQPHCSPRLQTS